jgi:hypothetical protein
VCLLTPLEESDQGVSGMRASVGVLAKRDELNSNGVGKKRNADPALVGLNFLRPFDFSTSSPQRGSAVAHFHAVVARGQYRDDGMKRIKLP